MELKNLHDIFLSCGRVSTDSRTLTGGELFFALKGENFDGNEYAVKALEAGASYAVVSESFSGEVPEAYRGRLIRVPDTLEALQALARYHRSTAFVSGKPLPVVGLTGTSGKTTTKELIRAVLSVRHKVTATEGNLNNSIGVPLTLLKITPQTQIAVVEMGASHPGDIKELTSVALPTYGLITNVGKAHLLGFGSFEGVMKTKGELYDYLQRTADKAFLDMDNPYLRAMASERPDLLTIPYGLSFQNAEVLDTDENHPYLRMRFISDAGSKVELDTQLMGAYNASNVMAAIAVGKEFGVSLEEAVSAISAYVPSNSRSQLVRTGRNTLIVDVYNANPSSMNAALDNLEDMKARHKAVMLGDMLELGEDSLKEHSEIVRRVRSMGVEAFFVGNEFGRALAASDVLCGNAEVNASPDAAGECAIRHFSTSDDLAAWLAANPSEGRTIRIKGSRGMRMEKAVPQL